VQSVQIVVVENKQDLEAFIDLPWKVYEGCANWVPPLKKAVRHLLDVRRHPYWKFSRRVLFLARRGSETVGRIAGIVDNNYNQYHKTGMGIWGFFECMEDPEAARALFNHVSTWVRKQGMTYLCGPFNPSTNYEVGLLIDGFKHRGTFMMPYNHPYYCDLVEACGFYKEKDLLSFIVDSSCRPPEWMTKLAGRLKAEGRYTLRTGDLRNLDQEVIIVKQLYDESWSDNWGFVPMTPEEMSEMAKELRQIADQDLFFFIYDRGEPVAAGLAVPDVSPLLKRFDGKVGLTGIIKYLLYRKEIVGARGLLFGVKKAYRNKGIPFMALDFFFSVNSRKYQYIELGWNLEDNKDINEFELQYGARFFKRYRIYRKNFADRW
jgi:hypothetical protein